MTQKHEHLTSLHPLTIDQLAEIKTNLHIDTLKLLVIDEISNVDPTTFSILNIHLQQIMQNQLHLVASMF